MPSFDRTHFHDGLTLSFNALTVMVFADLKGIFLGTRPSKVEHAAKTGWSGLSEPALLVDDMSVRDSWARRLEASAQDQRGFYQDGISLDLSSLWNKSEVKRGRGLRSCSIYFLRKCVSPFSTARAHLSNRRLFASETISWTFGSNRFKPDGLFSRRLLAERAILLTF